DGAMFVGPPESNRLWQESLSAREPDSPMVRPVVNRGRQVRLGSTRADVYRPGLAEWEHPRVLFLQHPSDPVVWWSPDLLLRRPAWLSQPRGHDVSPRMRWYPIVTFLQVTGDMAVANAGPTGHGHRY